MTIKERRKYCIKCKNKALDYDKNIICGLTMAPPVFEKECKYFVHKDFPEPKTKTRPKNNFFWYVEKCSFACGFGWIQYNTRNF